MTERGNNTNVEKPKKPSQEAALRLLLATGKNDSEIRALWMYHTLTMLKKIHNIFGFVVTVATIYTIYRLVVFVMDNFDDKRLIYDHVGAMLLALVIVVAFSKWRKGK